MGCKALDLCCAAGVNANQRYFQLQMCETLRLLLCVFYSVRWWGG